MSNQPVGGGGEFPVAEVRHPQVHYDRSDLSSRGIYMFLVGLVVVAAFIHFVIWGLWRYLSRAEAEPVRPRTEVVLPARSLRGDPALRFPAPRLQPDPVADMDKFRTQVEERLNSYGWVDQKAGIVHIPIERAIELTAQRGLPVRTAPEGAGAKAGTRGKE